MTAFHSMMLSGHGLPDMPPGGSPERRLKSRMRRRLQLVDWARGQGQSIVAVIDHQPAAGAHHDN